VLYRITRLAIGAPWRIMAGAGLIVVVCAIIGLPVVKSLSAGISGPGLRIGKGDPSSE
jgi:RND superfamily putative drug exporter